MSRVYEIVVRLCISALAGTASYWCIRWLITKGHRHGLQVELRLRAVVLAMAVFLGVMAASTAVWSVRLGSIWLGIQHAFSDELWLALGTCSFFGLFAASASGNHSNVDDHIPRT
jgi:hypothetical protein